MYAEPCQVIKTIKHRMYPHCWVIGMFKRILLLFCYFHFDNKNSHDKLTQEIVQLTTVYFYFFSIRYLTILQPEVTVSTQTP